MRDFLKGTGGVNLGSLLSQNYANVKLEVGLIFTTIGSIVNVKLSPSSVEGNGSSNLVYTLTHTGDVSSELTVNFDVLAEIETSRISRDARRLITTWDF